MCVIYFLRHKLKSLITYSYKSLSIDKKILKSSVKCHPRHYVLLLYLLAVLLYCFSWGFQPVCYFRGVFLFLFRVLLSWFFTCILDFYVLLFLYRFVSVVFNLILLKKAFLLSWTVFLGFIFFWFCLFLHLLGIVLKSLTLTCKNLSFVL